MKFKKVKNVPNPDLKWEIFVLWLTEDGWEADPAAFPDTASARFHAKLCNRITTKQTRTASDFCVGYIPACMPNKILVTFSSSNPNLVSIPVKEVKWPANP